MINFQRPTEQQDDWFLQFDPSQASPSSPTAGGGTMGTVANGGIQGVDPNATPSGITGMPVPLNGQTTGGTKGGDPAAFGQAWLASGGRTVADLQAFVAAHPEFGATLFGSKGDKIKFANGEEYDGVLSAGAGGLGATFNKVGGAGMAAGGGGMLGAMGPWMQPYDKQYTLPTAGDLQTMPGFQVGMDAFNRASQNSAAARGTLLNGRTNEAMNQAAGNYAMQNYGMLASLGKGAFDTNYQIARNNQNDPFDKAYRTAALGKPGA